MPFSMSQATIPPLELGLNALAGLLDKAEAYAAEKKIDATILLNTRLAPDMFSLVKQVQAATDMAKNGASRLAGAKPPRYEDTEKTMDEMKARVAKTLALVKSADRKQIDASADRQLTFPLGPHNKGEMKGDDYLTLFLLPNFYFHLTAAYAILRHCGVQVGKLDYLAGIPMKMSPS